MGVEVSDNLQRSRVSQVTNLSNFSYECQCMHVGAIVLVVKQGWHFHSTKNASRAIQKILESKPHCRAPSLGAPLNFLGAPLLKNRFRETTKKLFLSTSRSLLRKEKDTSSTLTTKGETSTLGVDTSRKTTRVVMCMYEWSI